MVYKYIRIEAIPASLDEITDPQSGYSYGGAREKAVAESAPYLAERVKYLEMRIGRLREAGRSDLNTEQWYLEFYRLSQAGSYDEAKEDGSLRQYPVDPPMQVEEGMRAHSIGDMMDVIDMACDMMDSSEKVNYYLTRDGKIMDQEEWDR